jgi:hypothetical protein
MKTDQILESETAPESSRIGDLLAYFERGLKHLDYEMRRCLQRGEKQKGELLVFLANDIQYAIARYREACGKRHLDRYAS